MATALNEAFLRVYATSIVKQTLASKGVGDEYLEVDTLVHGRGSKERVALLVAFLQSHETPVRDLDEEVLRTLVEELEARKLMGGVDDISVNLWQWRNNEAVFSPLLEE